MVRRQLFELEDLRWLPRFWRDGMTSFLAALEERAQPCRAFVPQLARALRATRARVVVDLGSGGGGPWLHLREQLAALGIALDVVLTDIEPNGAARARLERDAPRGLRWHRAPVDARAVPIELAGFRTFFHSFHHLRPADARDVLHDAARRGEGIALFESTHPSFAAALAMGIFAPLACWFVTPTMRPPTVSRFVFTYLVPLIPLGCAFDGFASCLRTYSVEELRALARDAAVDGYVFEVGHARMRGAPFPATWLLGLPAVAAARSDGHDEVLDHSSPHTSHPTR